MKKVIKILSNNNKINNEWLKSERNRKKTTEKYKNKKTIIKECEDVWHWNEIKEKNM